MTVTVCERFGSVEDLLAAARLDLDRLNPGQAAEAVSRGALLVDIRPAAQRAVEGEIPGSLVVERNHLEWRLHPSSDDRLPPAAAGQRWIVVCSEGYTSSLAAAVLNSIGVPATDVDGGFVAWAAFGLPTSTSVTAADQFVS